jgi:hypothetical protein
MTNWRIRGYRSTSETGFDRIVGATEERVRRLLERLTARHLTEDEITDATIGSFGYFEINREKRGPKEPMQLSTTGTDHHYVAVEISDASRT